MENEIGIRLRKFIVEQGLSIKEFAEKIGISPSSLTNYLLGKADIQKIFIALSKKADINLQWLISGTGNAKNSDKELGNLNYLDTDPLKMPFDVLWLCIKIHVRLKKLYETHAVISHLIDECEIVEPEL